MASDKMDRGLDEIIADTVRIPVGLFGSSANQWCSVPASRATDAMAAAEEVAAMVDAKDPVMESER